MLRGSHVSVALVARSTGAGVLRTDVLCTHYTRGCAPQEPIKTDSLAEPVCSQTHYVTALSAGLTKETVIINEATSPPYTLLTRSYNVSFLSLSLLALLFSFFNRSFRRALPYDRGPDGDRRGRNDVPPLDISIKTLLYEHRVMQMQRLASTINSAGSSFNVRRYFQRG